MMETSQPRKVLDHLYAMCQSLKSTNRVGLHIKMMHILYECVQTLNYFCFLHDKLEERPMLDIDRDVDFGEWAQKEWIDTDRFALIWKDGQMEAYVKRLATEETSGGRAAPNCHRRRTASSSLARRTC